MFESADVNPACELCDRDPRRELSKSDDLALCSTHWNRWAARYLGQDAPCSAHLIGGQE